MKEKYELMYKIDINHFSTEISLKIMIAGIKLELNYSGRNSIAVSNFLNEYFKDFERFDEDPDARIYYHQRDDIYGEASWPYWNIWTEEIEFIEKKDEQFDFLMERDFVAKVSKDGKSIFAYGPSWSFETCDSLDNIVSYMLGRNQIIKNSFILHAATVSDGQYAYVFFGASGAGKSTLADHCYKMNGLKVISSDQVIIIVENDKIFAQVMPTTIPEFPLNHSARESRKMPVRSMMRLIQAEGLFNYTKLSEIDWLKYLMKELVYRKEFKYEKELLSMALKLASNENIIKGEFSYLKGTNFFEELKKRMEQR